MTVAMKANVDLPAILVVVAQTKERTKARVWEASPRDFMGNFS
jgi:hypothetical protein